MQRRNDPLFYAIHGRKYYLDIPRLPQDDCVIGHEIIGFSDTSNARSRPDQRALEVRFMKYQVLHNFLVISLNQVFLEFLSARSFFKKVLHQRDSWSQISSSQATLTLKIDQNSKINHSILRNIDDFVIVRVSMANREKLRIRTNFKQDLIRINRMTSCKVSRNIQM